MPPRASVPVTDDRRRRLGGGGNLGVRPVVCGDHFHAERRRHRLGVSRRQHERERVFQYGRRTSGRRRREWIVQQATCDHTQGMAVKLGDLSSSVKYRLA